VTSVAGAAGAGDLNFIRPRSCASFETNRPAIGVRASAHAVRQTTPIVRANYVSQVFRDASRRSRSLFRDRVHVCCIMYSSGRR